MVLLKFVMKPVILSAASESTKVRTQHGNTTQYHPYANVQHQNAAKWTVMKWQGSLEAFCFSLSWWGEGRRCWHATSAKTTIAAHNPCLDLAGREDYEQNLVRIYLEASDHPDTRPVAVTQVENYKDAQHNVKHLRLQPHRLNQITDGSSSF